MKKLSKGELRQHVEWAITAAKLDKTSTWVEMVRNYPNINRGGGEKSSQSGSID